MRIYVEKILEMNKTKNSYRESANRRFEDCIEDLQINNNFISDLTKLLTNKEMKDIYNCFKNFSIEMKISAKIDNSKRFSDNTLVISKSENFINIYLHTYSFIYSILRYDCEKETLELLPDNNRFKTKMPSFLLAKLFFEELELIMQTETKKTRIKSIYNANRY